MRKPDIMLVLLVAAPAGCGPGSVDTWPTSSETGGEPTSTDGGDADTGDGDPADDELGDDDDSSDGEQLECSECNIFEVCEDGACVGVGSPPPSCDRPPYLGPSFRTIDDPYVLDVAFVDVDADGADELLLAGEGDLYLFEFGSDVPTFAGTFEAEHQHVHIAAGYFDAQPGEDLAIVVNNDYFPPVFRLSSDGVASFGGAVVELSPTVETWIIAAGNFDGLPEDLLLDNVLRLDDLDIHLTNRGTPQAAAFHEQGTQHPGITLAIESMLVRYDFDGTLLASVEQPANRLVSVLDPTHPSYLATEFHLDPYGDPYWSRLRLRDAEDLEFISEFVLPGSAMSIAGDFDGDLEVELFVVPYSYLASGAIVVRDLFTAPCLVPVPFGVDEAIGIDSRHGLEVGDHDGDGDLEVGLLTEQGLALFDLE